MPIRRTWDLFFYLASHAPWERSPDHPRVLLAALDAEALGPDLIDDADPPKRTRRSRREEEDFWLGMPPGEGYRWLFFRRRRHDCYHITVTCVDRQREPIRSRGDYHSLYGSIRTGRPARAVRMWRRLCPAMGAFHGLLDTYSAYSRRAHEVLPDGTVRKNTGWYSRCLPGLFARNYFGDVFLRNWGPTVVASLPPDPVSAPHRGRFLTAPSGLRDLAEGDAPYSRADLDVIGRIGGWRFHRPGQPGVSGSGLSLREIMYS